MRKVGNKTSITDEGTGSPLDQVYQLIEQRFHEPLSISYLARYARLNEYSLKTGFKRTYRISIHQFVITKRMERAKTLLETTSEPIKKIASLVGYKNRNFFGVFKKFYGKTPDTWRKGE